MATVSSSALESIFRKNNIFFVDDSLGSASAYGDGNSAYREREKNATKVLGEPQIESEIMENIADEMAELVSKHSYKVIVSDSDSALVMLKSSGLPTERVS